MTLPDTENDARWKDFYKFAGAMAILIVLAGLADMVVSMMGGEARENSTIPVVEWFELLQTLPIIALSNLGLINIITQVLGIPIYLALFNAHRRVNPGFAALSAILFFMGTAIYISSNTVFSMLALSRQYLVAVDAQKVLLEAAGRAALAHGADLTPGTYMGFLFTQTAGLIMALVILRGGIFSKLTGWVGLLGFSCMLIFFSLAAFAPAQFATAMLIAIPGGLLLIAYQLLIARKLFRMG